MFATTETINISNDAENSDLSFVFLMIWHLHRYCRICDILVCTNKYSFITSYYPFTILKILDMIIMQKMYSVMYIANNTVTDMSYRQPRKVQCETSNRWLFALHQRLRSVVLAGYKDCVICYM